MYARVSRWSWKISWRRWGLPGASFLLDLVDRFGHGMRAYWSTWMVNRPVDWVDTKAVWRYCVTDETMESPRELREIAAFFCPTLLAWSGGSGERTYMLYKGRGLMASESPVGVFIRRSSIVRWVWHALARTTKKELMAAEDDSAYEQESEEGDDELVWCLEALWIFSQSFATQDVSHLEYRPPRHWWKPVIRAMRQLVGHPSRVVACTARCVLAYAHLHHYRPLSSHAQGPKPLWENPALAGIDQGARSAPCNRPLIIVVELVTDMLSYLEGDSRCEQLLHLALATAVQRIESRAPSDNESVHPALRMAFAALWENLEKPARPEPGSEKDWLRPPPCMSASPISTVGGEPPLYATAETFGRLMERLRPVRDWLAVAEGVDANRSGEEPSSRSSSGKVRIEDPLAVEMPSISRGTGIGSDEALYTDASLQAIPIVRLDGRDEEVVQVQDDGSNESPTLSGRSHVPHNVIEMGPLGTEQIQEETRHG